MSEGGPTEPLGRRQVEGMETSTAILEAAGMAAEFLGGNAWAEHVDVVLARLALASRVNRVSIFENHSGRNGALLTSQRYEWVTPGESPQIADPELQAFPYAEGGFGRWISALGEGRVVHGPVRDLPVSERDVLQRRGILSIAVVPIFVGDSWWGFMVLDDRDAERTWKSSEVGALMAAANVFGAALQRRRMQPLEKRLVQLATFDELTGVPNRRALKEVMEREHGRATHKGLTYCVALLDVDRFKLVNDAFGHATGDRLLAAVAQVLKGGLRQGDWIARWGGEEFLCFLPETGAERGALIVERLRRRIEQATFRLREQRIEVSVSVGVAELTSREEPLEMVVARADSALSSAKQGGRNRVVVADNSHSVMSTRASQVQAALQGGRLRAAYQPIVALDNRQVVAEETLARILGDDGTMLEAGSFIEEASQMHLLHRIDHALIRSSMERCTARVLAGDIAHQFVNVSADLLRHPELVADLLRFAMDECSCCDDKLGAGKPVVIEITEREFLGDIRRVREILAPFLEFGLRLAIDDFGGGYSSFKYLAHLPATFLKIEGELIRLAQHDLRARAIVRSIHNTAGELGLVTVAECVEDESTANMLEDIGIDWAQGYHFGRPAVA